MKRPHNLPAFYRLIEVGEKLKQGDLFWCGRWVPTFDIGAIQDDGGMIRITRIKESAIIL